MLIKGEEVTTIEDVLDLLSKEEMEHAQRVACYTEACFSRAATKALYYSELKGSYEIQPENKEYAYKAGLYHDIGKLVTDDRNEHGKKGAELIEALYPKFKQEKSYHQRMLTDGALDHHENYDGTGFPGGKKIRQIGYMGRIVAIADEIDRRAVQLRSEDPIGDVLKLMKNELQELYYDEEEEDHIRKNVTPRFDENFFKCMSASAAQLRKAFDQYGGRDINAVPVSDTWIRRRGSRPMELRYQKMTEKRTKENMVLAVMRLRTTKGLYTDYDDMKKTINASKLGPKIGTYFLYELLDTLKRFSNCGVDIKKAAIMLPETWYSKPNLPEEIEQAFNDEELEYTAVKFIIPESLNKKPTKSFAASLEKCKKLGMTFITNEELEKKHTQPTEELFHEDDIAQEGTAFESEANS